MIDWHHPRIFERLRCFGFSLFTLGLACGQGGDLIRFVQLSRRQSFRQSLACLDPHTAPEADPVAVLEQAAAFWQFS